MFSSLVEFVATFSYVGRMPVVPGTLASAVGVLLAYWLRVDVPVYLGLFLAVTVLGFWSSGRMEAILQRKDPSCVVIDEVSGILIALFLLPWTPAIVWTAFFVFRAFDMFKIYPVGQFEKMKGGVGIMMDDVVAGIYTNLTMHAAVRLTEFLSHL